MYLIPFVRGTVSCDCIRSQINHSDGKNQLKSIWIGCDQLVPTRDRQQQPRAVGVVYRVGLIRSVLVVWRRPGTDRGWLGHATSAGDSLGHATSAGFSLGHVTSAVDSLGHVTSVVPAGVARVRPFSELQLPSCGGRARDTALQPGTGAGWPAGRASDDRAADRRPAGSGN